MPPIPLPVGQWLTLFFSDLHAYFCGSVLYCQSNSSWNCKRGVNIGILCMIRPNVDEIGALCVWKSAPASIINTCFSFKPAAIVSPAVPPPTKYSQFSFSKQTIFYVVEMVIYQWSHHKYAWESMWPMKIHSIRKSWRHCLYTNKLKIQWPQHNKREKSQICISKS